MPSRILDANLNRAREGLRVVEEYTRFVLDSRSLTERLKSFRHRLQKAEAALRSVAGSILENHRDTPGDTGTTVATGTEQTRSDTAQVARASLKRLEESLRVLEEYGKVQSAEAGALFEGLRYELYGIEPLILAWHTRKERLQEARLYVLITESLASADAITVCREAVAGGADLVQMREKEMEDGAFYEQAHSMNEICREGNCLFLINDRPHIASLVDADGIHTGQGDLPVHLSRRILGYDRIIGRSTSAPAFAEAAHAEGADYIGVGPVYETNTKQHRAAVGLTYVTWAAGNAKLPYFCIGSINRETVHGVLEAGASAIAVCTAIINARDIAAETAWFKAQLAERKA